MERRLREDLCGILEAIDRLHSAAKAESLAFGEANSALTRNDVGTLHEVHLAELNAVQILVARADLFRVRHRNALGYEGIVRLN